MQAEAAVAARREAQRAAALRNGPAPDLDAEEDAATMKARAWDDWKVRRSAQCDVMHLALLMRLYHVHVCADALLQTTAG
jgi:hypothetical protein